MTRKDELLASYDDALNYECESIELALSGITEEEAAFQHLVYRDEPLEEGYPPSGTILWQLVHLGYCYKRYRSIIENRPTDPPQPAAPFANTFAQAKENLLTYRKELRETVASLSEAQLDEQLFLGHSVIEHVRMSIRHDAWHMAQVSVARRLYRNRNK